MLVARSFHVASSPRLHRSFFGHQFGCSHNPPSEPYSHNYLARHLLFTSRMPDKQK